MLLRGFPRESTGRDLKVTFAASERCLDIIDKKLSYCCDSRSYCMQYFNAIHCDHNIEIEPSPLNKKSVCCQSADPTITPHLRPQSAHLCCTCSRTLWPFTALCHCWQKSRAFSTPSLSPIDTMAFLTTFLWCILWLNDTSYSKSVKRDK